ncbi:fatty acid desaturase [soil metagenome]
MLKHRADLQTVLYMLVTGAVTLAQWHSSHFNPALFLASLFLAFAVSAMHHNHAHVPMWRSSFMNRLTDYWFTLFQGHPGFLFFPAHLHNHHRFCNGARDFTRTYRYRDDNTLLGLMMHPMQSACTLFPVAIAYLGALWAHRKPHVLGILSHYLLLIACVSYVFFLDSYKAALYVVIPQLAALFFLLASNYLQHAHANECSAHDHSRNFVGWFNRLFFNVGYHSAHHHNSQLHWSCLPQSHRRIQKDIDPRLIEKSFAWYCLRVFILSLFFPALRSSSLRHQGKSHE